MASNSETSKVSTQESCRWRIEVPCREGGWSAQSLPKSNAVEDLFRIGNGCGVLETEPSAAVGDAVSANPVYQPDRQPERFRGLSTSGHVDSLHFFLSASCTARSSSPTVNALIIGEGRPKSVGRSGPNPSE